MWSSTSGAGDTASQRGALAVAGLFLVPLAPRSFDVWTVDKIAGLIDEARVTNPELRAIAVLNRADSAGGENAAAAEIIRTQEVLDLLPVTLGNRKSYARAGTSGLSVAELRPADPKAAQEVRDLFAALGLGVKAG